MTGTSREPDRGQIWTLDALLMVALMVGGMVFALQLFPIGDSQAVEADLVEAQLEQDLTDLLAVATASNDLLYSTVYWNSSGEHWIDGDEPGPYTRVPSDHPLYEPLTMVFDRTGVGYNIDIVYGTASGELAVTRMVYQGTPGRHGVATSASVVLYDDMNLTKVNGNSKRIGSGSFYAPDIFPESRKYNVLRVRILAWKQ